MEGGIAAMGGGMGGYINMMGGSMGGVFGGNMDDGYDCNMSVTGDSFGGNMSGMGGAFGGGGGIDASMHENVEKGAIDDDDANVHSMTSDNEENES